MTEPNHETLMVCPEWKTTNGVLHAVLRSELLRAEVHLYVDPTPTDRRYAWMVGQDALLVGDRAGSVEDAKLCARMTAIGAVLRGGLRALLAPHLTPSYEPPAGTPLPGGWTQQQDVQPWWSARAQHLYLQVTTCEGIDPTWTVWDGHRRLAGGTAPDVLRAATAAEQAARAIGDHARPIDEGA